MNFGATSNEAGATFELRVDGSTYAATAAIFAVNGLADGAHTIYVRARDAAGNIDATPATFDVVIDTQAPDTALVTSSPAALTGLTTGTFTFTSEANATFESSLDGASFAAATTPLTLNGLASGTHTVQIRAKDLAGNVDASPASFTWQIDATAPVATVVFPTRNSYTEANTLHVRGTASDVTTITAVTVNGVAATTSDVFAHWAAVVPIVAGNNTINIGTTDAFGNTSATAARLDVANRGPAISASTSLVMDTARSRALLTDIDRGAIIAIDGTTGRTSIVSDATRGTGPSLPTGGYFSAVMDSTHNRLLVMNGDVLLAVDPVSGNRTLIPTAASDPNTTTFGGAFGCNADCSLVYAIAVAPPSYTSGIFTINPQTGARTPFAGGNPPPIGAGFDILTPRDMVFDAVNSRLYVIDAGRGGVTAVNPATAERRLVTASSGNTLMGSGPALVNPRGLVLDLTNNRLIVTDTLQNQQMRLVAIKLSDGERSVMATTAVDASLTPATSMALDGSRLLINQSAGTVAQVSLASGEVRRHADSSVGTGMVINARSLLFDAANRTLLTTAQGGILRIDLATSNRTVAVPTPLAGGTYVYAPLHLNFDTRAGVPPDRLIGVGPGSSPNMFRAYDLAAGTDTEIVATQIPFGSTTWPLDAANGRFLASVFSGGSYQLVSFDATTGAQGATISDSTVGLLPFSSLLSIAFDEVGGNRRLLVADENQILAVDPATGIRTLISSASMGTGPTLVDSDSMAVNSTSRMALISSGRYSALQWVNLANGNRSMASGVNPDDQTVRGLGAPITHSWTGVAADFANDVAYMISTGETLLTVDLPSGDRVITSR